MLKDTYYLPLIADKFEYEPEIDYYLDSLNKKCNYSFIDCGANYGYWSIMVSCYSYIKEIFVIEPDKLNISFLKLNLSDNFVQVNLFQNAVYTIDEASVNFGGSANHTDLHITENKSDNFVQTISLETLISKANKKNKIIIKLDIEGMELDVLKKSEFILNQIDTLIYEDHGSDMSHKVTQYLLSRKMIIFYFDGKTFIHILNTKQLDYIKKQKTKGYNFFSIPSEKVEKLISNKENFEDFSNTY